MKGKIILTLIISLFLAAAINAQGVKSNFTGDWELDSSRSKFPETMPVESMTLKVAQTDTELTVESNTKRARGDARGGGRGGAASGIQNTVYNLEGKETVIDVGSGVMAGKETRKAAATADGKLNLNQVRVFTGEMGGATVKINEIWELIDAGRTLKILRYMETPRGALNSEIYLTKKSSGVLTVQGDRDLVVSSNDPAGMPKNTRNSISGGVLNGKALMLPKPEYPAAARAVKASGAVNVQVTIDENGSVISASAVSGHPLLRQAAEEAARNARFTATKLEGNPVKVTGVIVYNFVP